MGERANSGDTHGLQTVDYTRVHQAESGPIDLGYSECTVWALLSPPVGSSKARAARAAAMAHKNSDEQALARDDQALPSSSFATTTIIVVPSCSWPHSPGAGGRICSHRSNPWNSAGLLWSSACSFSSVAWRVERQHGGTWPRMMGSAAAGFPYATIALTEHSRPPAAAACLRSSAKCM